MSFYATIKQNPALLAEFIAKATPDTLSSAVLAWCKTHPALAGVTIPACLRSVRLKLNCPARRGGVRPRGESFYTVAARGREAA